MGGAVKKITKPVAKIFDKVIPNEIKPILPYVAAALPFVAPGVYGSMAGGLGSLGISNPMVQRAIISGGLNLGSQLSQEGAAERGINPLSLALAAGSGALTAPGGAAQLRGMQTGAQLGDIGTETASRTFLQKAKDLGLEGLAKSSEFLAKGAAPEATLMQSLKSATPSLIGAATEQSYNAALDAQKKYEQQLADFNAMTGQTIESSNQQRRFFINQSMQDAGFGTDEINDTLRSLGLFAVGGRVGYEGGGDVSYTDYETSGVIYRDPEGNPISKEEFLRRTYEEEKKPKKKKVEKRMYGGRIGYQNGGLVSLIYSPIVAKRSIGVR